MSQRTSSRQLALGMLSELCQTAGAPARSGDVFEALCAHRIRISSGDVSRALDSLSRTGHVRVVSMTFGLRSGGRRLYWPTTAGRPPACAGPAATPMAAVVQCIAGQARWRRGEPFTARDLAQRLADSGCHDGTVKAGGGGASADIRWSVVYAALRNLERRVSPLVRRLTDERGHIRWVWLGSPSAAGVLRNGLGPRASGVPAVIRAASGARSALAKRLVRLMDQEGRAAFSVAEVLSSAPSCEERDGLRRDLLAASDLSWRQKAPRGHRDRQASCTRAGEVTVVGWLEGRRYVALERHLPEAATALADLEHLARLGILEQHARVLARLRDHPRPALYAVMDEQVFLGRVCAVAGPLRLASVACAASPWALRLQHAVTRAQVLTEFLTVPTQAVPYPASIGGLRADETLEWCGGEALRLGLVALLGRRTPSAVGLRRRLASSTVWRSWRRGDDAGSPPRPGPGDDDKRRTEDRGREPVIWDRLGAMLWLGETLGGPRTRLVLRATRHLVMLARPAGEQLRATLDESDIHVSVGAAAYLACAGEWPGSVDAPRRPAERPAVDGRICRVTAVLPWLPAWLAGTAAAVLAGRRASEGIGACRAVTGSGPTEGCWRY